MLEDAVKKGLSFGTTSGTITTLGLIVGLDSSTNSKLAVIGGILVIAVADAFSDALGVHISEESIKKTVKQIWKSTFATWIAKFFVALSFAVPVLLMPLRTAVVVDVIWGFVLISGLSYFIARQEKVNPHRVITEHLAIAMLVVFITHYLGVFISHFFS